MPRVYVSAFEEGSGHGWTTDSLVLRMAVNVYIGLYGCMDENSWRDSDILHALDYIGIIIAPHPISTIYYVYIDGGGGGGGGG